MRILMLTHEFPPYRGGIGTYTAQLATAAYELGNEVVVVAPDFGKDLTITDKAEYPFQVERFSSSTYNYRKLPSLLWRAWEQCRRTDFDLLHTVDPSFTMALACVNNFVRVPFVATAYGTEILSLRVSRQASLLRTGDLFEKATAVFAISDYTKSLLTGHCRRVDANRIRVTPLGVDEYWFGKEDDYTKIRDMFEIPYDHRMILTVARLDERKGHVTVLNGISALSNLLKRNLTYVIVGSGSEGDHVARLHQRAQACGCRVVFIEDAPRDLLRQLYATADVFCMPGELHPKKVEGFGLAYLEAAAQGVPSIGSRAGAVPEVVRHEETGLLIEPGNELMFTRSLDRMLTDHGYRRTLGNNAKEWARNFTWRRCTELTYGQVNPVSEVLKSDAVER